MIYNWLHTGNGRVCGPRLGIGFSSFSRLVHAFTDYDAGGCNPPVISWSPSDGYLYWSMLAFLRLCNRVYTHMYAYAHICSKMPCPGVYYHSGCETVAGFFARPTVHAGQRGAGTHWNRSTSSSSSSLATMLAPATIMESSAVGASGASTASSTSAGRLGTKAHGFQDQKMRCQVIIKYYQIIQRVTVTLVDFR